IVARYVRLLPALGKIDVNTARKHELGATLLSEDYSAAANTLLDSLTQLDEVTKALQDRTLTLLADAPIVNNPKLESGIVKLISGQSLTPSERAECKPLKLPEEAPPSPEAEARSLVVLPTSNKCERLFSAAKLVYTDLRRRLDADTLEVLMFLSSNPDFWNARTIHEIRSGTPKMG
ncbi:TPA: hypothetical protein N0F65_000928, partial [Lagenidium giganteum]